MEGVKGEQIVIETPDKANAVYVAGVTFPMSDADPEDPALEVADFIFGSGTLSSRLGVRVRQKEGLSYGVSSRFRRRVAGQIGEISDYRRSAIRKNIDKVDAAVLDETDKMLKNGVSETEVREAKKAYLASREGRPRLGRRDRRPARRLLSAGRTFAYEVDLEKKLAALTAEQVSAAFKQYVNPAKLVIVEAGDFKKNAAPEK